MKNFKKRIAVFIVLGSMLLGISSSVLAAVSSTDSTGMPGVSSRQNGPGQPDSEREKTMLSQLVQEGIITQEEMDKIVTYFEENKPDMPTNTGGTQDTTGSSNQQMQPGQGPQQDMWSDLVTSGIITQAQADAIKVKMAPQGANPAADSANTNSSGVGVKIDNQTLTLNPSAQIINGRTLAPLRGIFEALGLTVSWDGTTQTIVGTKDGINITLQINSNNATVNGNSVSLDVPAQILNGSTFVPVRFIADSLGVTVNWNAQDRAVEITTK